MIRFQSDENIIEAPMITVLKHKSYGTIWIQNFPFCVLMLLKSGLHPTELNDYFRSDYMNDEEFIESEYDY